MSFRVNPVKFTMDAVIIMYLLDSCLCGPVLCVNHKFYIKVVVEPAACRTLPSLPLVLLCFITPVSFYMGLKKRDF